MTAAIREYKKTRKRFESAIALFVLEFALANIAVHEACKSLPSAR